VDVTPLVDKTDTTAIYTHSKAPVKVNVGDKVRYSIRIYNEGDINVRTGTKIEIEDYLPVGLEYDTASSINSAGGWTVNGRHIRMEYTLSSDLNKFSATPGYVTPTPAANNLSYFTVEIECIVTSDAEFDKVMTNIAQIYSDDAGPDKTILDASGVPYDIDSEPENAPQPDGVDLENYPDGWVDNDEKKHPDDED
jgi:fimbrial isopeptide formation D2 family protein